MTLLEKCNADVYMAILEIKEIQPEIGESMFRMLQKHESTWTMNLAETMWFAAHLPLEIWDRKVHTLNSLFQSQQQTTPNP
jgi:hypothetical protein